MASWAIAFAIGVSFTRPSDLAVRMPALRNDAVFRRVRWSGMSFVPSPYYSVRVARGGVALDYTHYKIYAATQDRVHEEGRWHGTAVDDDVRLDARVQHLEVTHGLNALALVALARDPHRRGSYAGLGPVVYLPHTESRIDGRLYDSGLTFGGTGVEALIGVGDAHRFAEIKLDAGRMSVRVADGSAATPLQTLHVDLAP